MIEKAKNYMLEQCKGTKWGWEQHLTLVAKYSDLLGKQLSADYEPLMIAAWTHDIWKIKHPGEPEHHLKGAEEIYQWLTNQNYQKANLVKQMITTHSSDENYPPITKEQKILATADALCHFETFKELKNFCKEIRKMNDQETNKWLKNKYANAWKKLMPEGKQIATEKYEEIKKILNQEKKSTLKVLKKL